MRVGDKQHPHIGFPHGLEERLGAGQVVDAVMHLAVQLQHVETEALAPVVEAIPFQVSLDRQVLGIQAVARQLVFEAIVLGIAAHNELFPDIGVERQIKDGAVHIQHERLAFGDSCFGIECHCFILRGPACDRTME